MDRKILKKGDYLIYAGAVFLLVFSFFRTYGPRPEKPESIMIRQDKDRISFRPLTNQGRFILDGPLGDSVILITNRTIRMVDSPCAHKLCIRQGALTHTGQVVVCLPNKIEIRLVNTNQTEKVHGVTR